MIIVQGSLASPSHMLLRPPTPTQLYNDHAGLQNVCTAGGIVHKANQKLVKFVFGYFETNLESFQLLGKFRVGKFDAYIWGSPLY